eukprot:PhF_6_TR28259/c1_g1_i1/m.41789
MCSCGAVDSIGAINAHSHESSSDRTPNVIGDTGLPSWVTFGHPRSNTSHCHYGSGSPTYGERSCAMRVASTTKQPGQGRWPRDDGLSVTRRLDMWSSGNFRPLWDRTHRPAETIPPPPRQPPSPYRRACNLAAEGSFKKALEALSQGSLQFGVGRPGGAAAMTHLVRRCMSSKPFQDAPDVVLAKLDFTNAFNYIDRQLILDATREYAPELLPWARWLYEDEANLLFGSLVVLSSQGVQQGDPLGPVLFSLALRKLLYIETAIDLISQETASSSRGGTLTMAVSSALLKW